MVRSPASRRVKAGTRRFWADERRVDAYDDAYWGYAEMGGTSLFAHDQPTHSEYQRPED